MFVSRWFTLRIQLLGSVLVLIVTGSLALAHDQLSIAVVGLVFTYALKVSQGMESVVHAVARVETMMISPERMKEYIDLRQEAPASVPGSDALVLPKWPAQGSIEFQNVNFRYNDETTDDLILRGVSFHVRTGEKIDIVGRTGAGKSSLVMALFRMSELASGVIRIDGVDVSQLGLAVLRTSVRLIPQSPTLFKGTVRSCLDPFGDYTDDQLWPCVREVGLQDRVTLDSVVE